MPGLLDACRRPFEAQGLAMPWYTAFGNHDPLVQGNFPTSLGLTAVAEGSLKLISPPAGLSQSDLLGSLRDGSHASLLQGLAYTPHVRSVTADPDRRMLTRAEIIEQHFITSGAPFGHGFTQQNRADNTAYYTFDQGLVRFIVLDTVNPNGEADGSLDAAQFAWLGVELEAAADRVVVLASHHTIDSMINPLVGTGLDPSTDSAARPRPATSSCSSGRRPRCADHDTSRPRFRQASEAENVLQGARESLRSDRSQRHATPAPGARARFAASRPSCDVTRHSARKPVLAGQAPCDRPPARRI